MAGVNKVIIVGNLGRDPELRYTQSGQPVCNLAVATSRRYTNRNQEAVEETEWHRVVVWGYTAEQIMRRPILGVGVNSTEPLDMARPDAERSRKIEGTRYEARTGGHPHSFYLQVLYENEINEN